MEILERSWSSSGSILMFSLELGFSGWGFRALQCSALLVLIDHGSPPTNGCFMSELNPSDHSTRSTLSRIEDEPHDEGFHQVFSLEWKLWPNEHPRSLSLCVYFNQIASKVTWWNQGFSLEQKLWQNELPKSLSLHNQIIHSNRSESQCYSRLLVSSGLFIWSNSTTFVP